MILGGPFQPGLFYDSKKNLIFLNVMLKLLVFLFHSIATFENSCTLPKKYASETYFNFSQTKLLSGAASLKSVQF